MDIMTYTGIFMDPLNPKEKELNIEDIAHALSMLCRANGHFPERHTVGQHCIECYEEALARGYNGKLPLFCLLHDGAEAFMGDFIRPVKLRMPGYSEAEDKILNMIYAKFAGRVPTKEEKRIIKEIDDVLLGFEFEHYMGVYLGDENQILASSPEFCEKHWQEVEKEYLEIYRKNA